MYKLGNLIISGAEVYSVPQAPMAGYPDESAPARTVARRNAGSVLRTLLRHSAAVGALPPVPRGHGR